jgi:HNH endonuclease
MPTPMTITGRSSTITNAFVNSLIPVVFPSEAEVVEALTVLGMAPGDVRCAYCGDPYTEWDHLHPLVIDQKPTGYISELANLVPSCGKCNQSKGKKSWREWMRSTAPRCPGARGVPDLESKIARLQAYENWREPKCVNFEAIVGREMWSQHWKNWDEMRQQMRKSQLHADLLKQEILKQNLH